MISLLLHTEDQEHLQENVRGMSLQTRSGCRQGIFMIKYKSERVEGASGAIAAAIALQPAQN